jgi:DNA-binding HxlR family transcriptional regulator
MVTSRALQPDAFLAACPSRAVLARLGEKWAMLVLVALSHGRLRFGELRRRVQGVSQKMLTQTLRALERDGLVRREVLTVSVLRVEYELTPHGAELVPIIAALKKWAEGHLRVVERANAGFDRRNA